MSNDEKIIKNPNRKPPGEIQKYTPNWVKLGVEPVVYENPEKDFIMMGKKKSRPAQQPAMTAPPSSQLPNLSNLSNHAEIIMKTKSTTPTSAPAVGSDTTGTWLDNHGPESEEIDYDDVSLPPLEGLSLTSLLEEVTPYDEEIDESDDVDSETSEDDTSKKSSDPFEDALFSEISTLDPDEYVLFVKGSVVLVSKDSEEVEKLIDQLIFESSTETITVNDLVLIKRVPLRVGVLISK